MSAGTQRHLTALPHPTDATSDPAPVCPPWPHLLTMFAAELRDTTPSARAGRLGQLRRLAREHPGSSAGELTPADLVDFLVRPEWSWRTRKAHRAAVVAFYGWAHGAGLILSNPAADLPRSRDLATTAPVADHSGRPSPHRLEPDALIDPEARHWAAIATEHPSRTWARSTGFPHAATGRLPQSLIAAWEAAGCPVVGIDRDRTTREVWTELIGAYTRELTARGLRPATIRLHTRRLVGLFAQLDHHPSQTTREDLIDYLAEPAWAPETRRGQRSTIVGFFAWAHETERLPSNPARRLPSVRVPHSVPHPAAETDIRDAVNRATAAGRDDVRLMILLGSLAGLRCAEITHLHTDHVNADELRITGKGGRVRLIPMHPSLAAELDAYCQRRSLGRGHLFGPAGSTQPYTTGWVSKLVSRYLPGGFGAHSLRHRFASRSYAGQYNLRAVQELLGHSSPVVTAAYVAVPDAAARDAVLAVPPIPGIETPASFVTFPQTRVRSSLRTALAAWEEAARHEPGPAARHAPE